MPVSTFGDTDLSSIRPGDIAESIEPHTKCYIEKSRSEKICPEKTANDGDAEPQPPTAKKQRKAEETANKQFANVKGGKVKKKKKSTKRKEKKKEKEKSRSPSRRGGPWVHTHYAVGEKGWHAYWKWGTLYWCRPGLEPWDDESQLGSCLLAPKREQPNWVG